MNLTDILNQTIRQYFLVERRLKEHKQLPKIPKPVYVGDADIDMAEHEKHKNIYSKRSIEEAKLHNALHDLKEQIANLELLERISDSDFELVRKQFLMRCQNKLYSIIRNTG